MADVLSEAEVSTYAADGYVVPKAILPPEFIDRMRNALDSIVARNPTVRPERLVSAHLADSGVEGVKGDTAFFELATHPMLLQAVSQLIGPDFALWGCQVSHPPSSLPPLSLIYPLHVP